MDKTTQQMQDRIDDKRKCKECGRMFPVNKNPGPGGWKSDSFCDYECFKDHHGGA